MEYASEGAGFIPALPALLCSILVSASAAWGSSAVVRIVAGDRGDDRRGDALETRRRASLRQADRFYRWFEPIVDDRAEMLAERRPRVVSRIARQQAVLLDEPPWRPAEWLALARLRGIAWALFLGLFLAITSAEGADLLVVLAMLPIAFAGSMRLAFNRLDAKAATARGEIRRSLPFALDLWTLMFRAGSTFRPAIGTIVRHFPLSTFSAHLDRLGQDLDRGLPRDQALTAFATRLGMEEVDALVFAINQGEALGTPLGQVLTMQAQQMRDRQSNAIERAAERIKIKFNGPGVVAMFASILTMLAPFLASVSQILER